MALSLLPQALRSLLHDLERLPGIGPKSAQRIAFALLRQSPEVAQQFATDLQALHTSTRHCVVCGMLTEEDRCAICRDSQRDASLLCVVETPLDVIAIERTGEYRGRYHVLNGTISPLDRIGPEDLNIASLLERVGTEHPQEIILALNPSVEGETTALYLKKLLSETGVRLSRLAQGLPTGAALEFADDLTITRAIVGRRTVE